MTGHPKHQLRVFKVKVRDTYNRDRTVEVTAQTQLDAVLHAGLLLGAEMGMGVPMSFMFVLGVEDPADAPPFGVTT
jgi:hypothetical protein